MNLAAGRSRLERPTWSVSELNRYIRDLFEVDMRLRDVQLEGEISNWRPARSGHLYFTLKDSASQIACVMWRSDAGRLTFGPDNGDAVVARGYVSVYETSGAYQFYVQTLRPAGRGQLALAFEQLKQRLAAEGLFDPAHKKALPPFPRRLGVVTSADAAALRDILNVLRRRYPLATVLIAPTLVQGVEAPPQIVRALQWLDGRDDVDVILVARGGGSLEDLWAFNDEGVARAIFAARHPIISGVGHEIDFTIADFVADVRAPTPSAAAELATPDVAELWPLVAGLRQALDDSLIRRLEQQRRQLQALSRALHLLRPQAQVASYTQRLDDLWHRLGQAMIRRLTQAQTRLDVAGAALKGVSPLATLARGYAIVHAADGRVVASVHEVAPEQTVEVRLVDGRLALRVETVQPIPDRQV